MNKENMKAALALFFEACDLPADRQRAVIAAFDGEALIATPTPESPPKKPKKRALTVREKVYGSIKVGDLVVVRSKDESIERERVLTVRRLNRSGLLLTHLPQSQWTEANPKCAAALVRARRGLALKAIQNGLVEAPK